MSSWWTPSTPSSPEPVRDLQPAPYAGGRTPELATVLSRLLPPANGTAARGRDVVILLDGVGSELIREHRSLTPTLRGLENRIAVGRTVAPSTTATAMATLLTGRSPIEHGVLGYTVLDPDGGPAVNQLTGAPGVDPGAWMPLPGLVEASERRALHVGPRRHEGSHLTRAIYRGWDVLGHARTSDRLDTIREAVRRGGPDGLVLVHVPDVDHAGHVHGVDSAAWRAALEDADSLLATLRRVLPRGTRMTVTADHGMVDRDPAAVIDLAAWPELSPLITHVAGEARALSLRVRDEDAAQQAAERLRERLAGSARVLTAAEVRAEGLLGPTDLAPDPRVASRLPDLLLWARGRVTLRHTALQPRSAHQEVGVHGSLTKAETRIPLLRMIAGE